MPGAPKKRARREALGLPVAPRSTSKPLHFSFNVASLRKMRMDGMSVPDLYKMGMTQETFVAVMGYEDGTANPDVYIPTSEERYAVEAWVVAGFGHPAKLKEMLLEDFGLDLSVSVIERAFRVERMMGKERVVVGATKNVIAAIKEGDVASSFKYLDQQAKKSEPPPPPGNTYNVQINITPQEAQSTYLSLVKGR